MEFFVVCFIFIGEHLLWGERKNMKRTRNYKKQDDAGVENTIAEIKKPVRSSEWTIIGGKKAWTRTCNGCQKTIVHHNYTSYSNAVRHGHKCKKCFQPCGEKNSFYGKKHSKKNLKLLSELNSGKNNPMYGTIGGMFGKKQSEKQKKAQSKYKKEWWKKQGHTNITEFERYRYKVDALTRAQPIHLLENFTKRGKAGVNGAYHLDHIVSVWKGFHNGISPEKIANIKNLRFIPWLENQKKWYK